MKDSREEPHHPPVPPAAGRRGPGSALAAVPLALGTAASADPASDWQVSLSGTGPATELLSVSAAGPDDAWAGGLGPQGGVIMRWKDGAWQQDTTAGLPHVWQWSAVSAVSADDVWAYGTQEFTQTLVHYDGTSWTTVPTTGPEDSSFPDVPLAAVAGRLFKGGDALYTYSGGTWQTYALPAGVDIRAIDAVSADDAYATGMRYPVETGAPVVYHWDGTTWTPMAAPAVPAGTDIATMTVDGPDSVYVAGWAAGEFSRLDAPDVEHWDGTSWTDVTGAMSSFDLTSLIGDGHGGLWAAGADTTVSSRRDSAFWHYDGSTWTKEPGAVTPDDTGSNAYNVEALAPAGPSGAVWAAGSVTLPLDPSGDEPDDGLIQHLDAPTADATR